MPFRSVVLLVLSLLVPKAFGQPFSYRSCRADQFCVRLTECQSYMNLIRNVGPLTEATIAFLKQQECDFDGSYPKVCCFQSRPGNGGQEITTGKMGLTTKPASRGSYLSSATQSSSADSKDQLKKKRIEALNEALAQMDFFVLRQH